jgi:putative addiction module component (TIGR02574 family)
MGHGPFFGPVARENAFDCNSLTTCDQDMTMGQITLDELRQLSVAERIQLVEDLWDSIAAVAATAPLSEAQKSELDHRLSEPDGPLYSWADIKANLLGGE